MLKRIFERIRRTYGNELSLIRIYIILYAAGIIVGLLAAVLLRKNFSSQARFLFSAESVCGFGAIALQQVFTALLLFLLGFTMIGVWLLPFYPFYKGFSVGLILALGVIYYGFKGFFLSSLAFLPQNLCYSFLGYFLCCSAAKLSVLLLQSVRHREKHGTTYRDYLSHLICFAVCILLSFPVFYYEARVVPLILRLF